MLTYKGDAVVGPISQLCQTVGLIKSHGADIRDYSK